MSEYKYKRVLLKLSGEALMGGKDFGIDESVPQLIAKGIKPAHDAGVDIAVVVGGGNIFRGLTGAAAGMDRAQADNMGMLATVINSLSLQDTFEKAGMDCRVMSALEIRQVAETYFTTDTAAALRACEIGADVLMKATKVDGIYDMDPVTHPEAKKFDTITYSEVLTRNLQVMDSTATALCKDNHMPIMVFNLEGDNAFDRALRGEPVGTTVVESEE